MSPFPVFHGVGVFDPFGLELIGTPFVPLFDAQGVAKVYALPNSIAMHPWHLQTLTLRDKELPPDEPCPIDGPPVLP